MLDQSAFSDNSKILHSSTSGYQTKVCSVVARSLANWRIGRKSGLSKFLCQNNWNQPSKGAVPFIVYETREWCSSWPKRFCPKTCFISRSTAHSRPILFLSMICFLQLDAGALAPEPVNDVVCVFSQIPVLNQKRGFELCWIALESSQINTNLTCSHIWSSFTNHAQIYLPSDDKKTRTKSNRKEACSEAVALSAFSFVENFAAFVCFSTCNLRPQRLSRLCQICARDVKIRAVHFTRIREAR